MEKVVTVNIEKRGKQGWEKANAGEVKKSAIFEPQVFLFFASLSLTPHVAPLGKLCPFPFLANQASKSSSSFVSPPLSANVSLAVNLELCARRGDLLLDVCCVRDRLCRCC